MDTVAKTKWSESWKSNEKTDQMFVYVAIDLGIFWNNHELK